MDLNELSVVFKAHNRNHWNFPQFDVYVAVIKQNLNIIWYLTAHNSKTSNNTKQ